MDAISTARSAESSKKRLTDSEKVDISDGRLEYQTPFGDDSGEVQYQTMSWWQCGMVMIAETISLGILSFPAALAAIGLVPGVIIIIGIGIIATYAGYIMGQFKQRYPHVHNMADAGEVMWGRIGGELLGSAQLILILFGMASHILTFTVAMNKITGHGTCSIVFGLVGLAICFIGTIPRTMRNVARMSIASFASITIAVLITMIAIGIQRPGKGTVGAVAEDASFYHAFLGVTNIVFGFFGSVIFFSFMSEMKNPNDYPKALCLLQTTEICMYVVVAVVIYYYGGEDVTSPALGSTGNLVSRIAYGMALPTILIGGIIGGHVSSKYIYVRLFRGTGRMNERTFVSIGSWCLIALVLWVIAWIIAEAIPNFSNLLSLIAALFASWFTFSLCSYFWFFINRGQWFSTPRKIFLSVVNMFIFLIGVCVCGLGLYVSGRAIHEAPSGHSFSCANQES
ncbi:transmembrane amino acid transporter protein-domain-containing protein [Aspergillus avenaceus]|uniref:Transmembrane amino acid transporter protein-domain-containing protein n=1 Tax=Aspergillus avenaceus TaxID=36643 RepID=A0A5N6U0B7_ASPAV|nr:transmembrane amino acid transporter protein-domain-containing protein [Aspergillus avenaceus]